MTWYRQQLTDRGVASLRQRPPEWAKIAAEKLGFSYKVHRAINLRKDVRLDNVPDLLQYAHYRLTLGGRMRSDVCFAPKADTDANILVTSVRSDGLLSVSDAIQ